MADDGSDFLTPLAQCAQQIHETYLSFLEAGFDDRQAFELVRAIVVNASRPQQGGDE